MNPPALIASRHSATGGDPPVGVVGAAHPEPLDPVVERGAVERVLREHAADPGDGDPRAADVARPPDRAGEVLAGASVLVCPRQVVALLAVSGGEDGERGDDRDRGGHHRAVPSARSGRASAASQAPAAITRTTKAAATAPLTWP